MMTRPVQQQHGQADVRSRGGPQVCYDCKGPWHPGVRCQVHTRPYCLRTPLYACLHNPETCLCTHLELPMHTLRPAYAPIG
eukprot:3866187-Rhodomonas_salina.1